MAAIRTAKDIEGWAMTVAQEPGGEVVTVWVGWASVKGMHAYTWKGSRVAMFAQEWTLLPGAGNSTHSGWCNPTREPMPWWAWNIVQIRLRQELA